MAGTADKGIMRHRFNLIETLSTRSKRNKKWLTRGHPLKGVRAPPATVRATKKPI
jgi:hypothetical protein